MAPIPLTLAAGGVELRQLVPQLAQPPDRCAVVGSSHVAPAGSAVIVESRADPLRPDDGREVCTDLIDGIVRAVGRPGQQRLVVALDHRDDAVTAALTILSSQALADLVFLDAVIVTVDAVRLATRLASGLPVDSAIGLDRLAIADRILVARSHEVTPAALAAIGHVLRSVNQTGPVIAPAIAPCPLDDLIDLDAWSGRPAFGPPPGTRSPVLGPDAPLTVVCRSDDVLDIARVDEWLSGPVARHARHLLRLQGVIDVPDQPSRICIRGVGSFIETREEAVQSADADNESVVVLIGRSLPADTLRAEFAASNGPTWW